VFDPYRALIENACDVFTIVDAEGRVLYDSPSLERLIGYRPEEMQGRDAFELVHPDDAPSMARLFAELLAKGRGPGPRAECRVRHRDGTWRHVEAFAVNLLDDPNVGGVVVNIRDITTRRAAEEALRRSEEELRQARQMEAIGRLAGGVAHDFNNLLTVILGRAESILAASPPGGRLHADAAEISGAAGRAASFTQKLLAVSRRQVLHPAVVDVSAVVSRLAELLRRLVGDRVELAIEAAPAPALVVADPFQLEQVVVNLAVNARDAMPAGGRLTISTGLVDGPGPAGVPGPGPHVALVVADTGEGMGEETLAHLFEPYFRPKERRAGRSRPEDEDARGRAVGLGLSTVLGIVQQSGGVIRVESAPGSGTAFRVYLPRVERGLATRPGPAAAASAPPAGETVLVAEDEPLVRTLVAQILEAAGYRVIEAADGVEAVQALERAGGGIALVLTDVVMPRLGGVDLARCVREVWPGTPILLMSGYAEDELAEIARPGAMPETTAPAGESRVRFAAPVVLEKPFAPAELLRQVQEALARRYSPRSSA